MAHISLSEDLHIRNIVGHFKFINLYILLFNFSFLEIKKKTFKKKFNIKFNIYF